MPERPRMIFANTRQMRRMRAVAASRRALAMAMAAATACVGFVAALAFLALVV